MWKFYFDLARFDSICLTGWTHTVRAGLAGLRVLLQVDVIAGIILGTPLLEGRAQWGSVGLGMVELLGQKAGHVQDLSGFAADSSSPQFGYIVQRLPVVNHRFQLFLTWSTEILDHSWDHSWSILQVQHVHSMCTMDSQIDQRKPQLVAAEVWSDIDIATVLGSQV